VSSIRTRLATRFAALTLAVVAVFAGTVYGARRTIAVAELEKNAQLRADIALRIVRQAGLNSFQVTTDGRTLVGPLKQSLDALPGYLVINDANGERIYSSPAVRTLSAYLQGGEIIEFARADYEGFEHSLTEARTATTATRFRLRNDDGLLVLRRDLDGREAIQGVSFRESAQSWKEILGSALIVLPFLVLMAVSGAYVLAGNVLKPVDTIRQEVEAITDGRSLHRRVAVEGADDEMARLANTLNDMISRLETSFGGLRRFTADASHELKTPLAVLRADVERAMHARPHSNEQAVALEEALQETARMADLVDSLLTLARADEGRFDLHREPVDLEEVARDVFETALILGEDTGLQVSMTSSGPAMVNGDRTRLRQLFLNLITNAIKYTPRGGRVDLSLSVADRQAHFAVKDTGIGIAAVDLDHVFERFWRADRARSRMSAHGGQGLGLAISQWIAQAHGGQLVVQSRLHRGSTFTAILPVSTATPTPAPRESAAAQLSPASTVG
jgi:signal transduction histidine kinase